MEELYPGTTPHLDRTQMVQWESSKWYREGMSLWVLGGGFNRILHVRRKRIVVVLGQAVTNGIFKEVPHRVSHFTCFLNMFIGTPPIKRWVLYPFPLNLGGTL